MRLMREIKRNDTVENTSYFFAYETNLFVYHFNRNLNKWKG